jgi:hypothetical protein
MMKGSTMTIRRMSVTIQLVGMAVATCAAEQPSPPTDARLEGYKLVWADEFNKAGRPDPNNWTYEHGFVRNEELQWYQPDNARCEDGLLIIEARREQKRNPNYDPTDTSWRRNRQYAAYTSACLKTRGLHSLEVWAFRNAGSDRHPLRLVARLLDAGLGPLLARLRRDRHHGVLPGNAAGQRLLGRRKKMVRRLG